MAEKKNIFGKKKAARTEAVQSGGTLRGGQAKKAAKETDAGRLGDDNRVRDSRGRVTGDFRGRTMRQPNEHGV